MLLYEAITLCPEIQENPCQDCGDFPLTASFLSARSTLPVEVGLSKNCFPRSDPALAALLRSRLGPLQHWPLQDDELAARQFRVAPARKTVALCWRDHQACHASTCATAFKSRQSQSCWRCAEVPPALDSDGGLTQPASSWLRQRSRCDGQVRHVHVCFCFHRLQSSLQPKLGKRVMQIIIPGQSLNGQLDS